MLGGWVSVSSSTWLTLSRYSIPVRTYTSREIAGENRTAIAWTTAGSVAAVIEMVSQGRLPREGFLKQEDVPFEAFLSTTTGKLFETSD